MSFTVLYFVSHLNYIITIKKQIFIPTCLSSNLLVHCCLGTSCVIAWQRWSNCNTGFALKYSFEVFVLGMSNENSYTYFCSTLLLDFSAFLGNLQRQNQIVVSLGQDILGWFCTLSQTFPRRHFSSVSHTHLSLYEVHRHQHSE